MVNCYIENSWNKYLSMLPLDKNDIYFSEEYLDLNKNDGIPECFIFQENENIWLFPYIKKQILYNNKIFWDFESQYGYGGPISNCNESNFIKRVHTAFLDLMKNEGFVAGLIRFHPLFNNHLLIEDIAKIFFNRNTIGIDLTKSIETIWTDEIHSKHRNSIRKAEKLNLNYVVDYDYKYYDDFKKVYFNTMEKNNADPFYFFDKTYFETLKIKFQNKSFLAHVLYNDKIISSAIFFYSHNYAHYHLSGSDENFLSLNPNTYLIYKTIEHVKSINKEILHLGGGSDTSVDNSLFRFKARFSKMQYNFYMGEIIINKNIYNNLCNEWENKNYEKNQKYSNKILKYRY